MPSSFPFNCVGKMFCQKCHFGESVELPSRLVNDLNTAKFSVCHVAKNELTRVFEVRLRCSQSLKAADCPFSID